MRICFVASYGHWGKIDPTLVEPGTDHMLGGGETSLIHVSKGLAALGHDVTVIAVTGRRAMYDGVQWIPINVGEFNTGNVMEARQALHMVGQLDAVIGCDWPQLFEGFQPQRAVVSILDSQCNHGVSDESDPVADLYIARSVWHGEVLNQRLGNKKGDKFVVLPNGIDPLRFTGKPEKHPHRVIWSSSPDRGLHHILRIWPRVREIVPDAELHVYYEFKSLVDLHRFGMSQMTDVMLDIEDGLKQPGVVHFGGVGQWTLANAQLESSMLAYTCDTIKPTEGFGITVLENMAAGNMCVLTDCDALPEIYGKAAGFLPLPIEDDAWASAITEFLLSPEKRAPYIERGYKLASELTWDKIAKKWEETLTEALEEKKEIAKE